MPVLNGVGLEIRPAGIEDAELLAKLGARTFAESFEEENEAEDMAAYLKQHFEADPIKKELADPQKTFLLAFLGGKAVGYVKLNARPAPPCVLGATPVELERIYVDKGCKGKKIGSSLLQEVFQFASSHQYETVWLGVWEHNSPAQAFYQKWGFTKAGDHDFILGEDVQNDFILVRQID